MNQHHDHIGPLRTQRGNQRVGCLSLIRKGQPRDAAGSHHVGRGLERHADEAHANARTVLLEEFQTRALEQTAAIAAQRVRGQKGELRALEGLADLAGFLAGEFLAAAVLQAQELLRALVVFMVSGGGKIHAHEVERLHRRLVQKQRRDHGRRAHHVARCHDCGVRVCGAPLCNGTGQVHRTARGHRKLLAGLVAGADRKARRLQIAVEIVETQQRNFHLCRSPRVGVPAAARQQKCQTGRATPNQSVHCHDGPG